MQINTVSSSKSAPKIPAQAKISGAQLSLKALLHRILIGFDHLFDHLAADGTGLLGGQVAIVTLLQVNANFLGGLNLFIASRASGTTILLPLLAIIQIHSLMILCWSFSCLRLQ